MNNLKIILTSTLLLSVLSGCSVSKTEYLKKFDTNTNMDPKFDPKLDEILSFLQVCNKSDAELGLPPLTSAEIITVKDKIENQDIVTVDCEGKQTGKSHGPIREFSQFLDLAAPEEVKTPVNYVVIENSRTCSVQYIDAGDEGLLTEQTIKGPNQEPIKIPGPTVTTLGFSGKLKILLSDSTLKIEPLFLNVHDNNNVITIKYYGKCLKYKEKLKDNLGDSINCAEGELLGKKEFLLSVLIDRPEVEGTYFSKTCTK